MKIKLARNNQGALRVKSPTDLGALADFLETDVNENLEYCQDILASINNSDKSPDPKYHENFCGNVYELEIRATEALLLNLHEDGASPLRIKLDELTDLLQNWQKELSIDDSDNI